MDNVVYIRRPEGSTTEYYIAIKKDLGSSPEVVTETPQGVDSATEFVAKFSGLEPEETSTDLIEFDGFAIGGHADNLGNLYGNFYTPDASQTTSEPIGWQLRDQKLIINGPAYPYLNSVKLAYKWDASGSEYSKLGFYATYKGSSEYISQFSSTVTNSNILESAYRVTSTGEPVNTIAGKIIWTELYHPTLEQVPGSSSGRFTRYNTVGSGEGIQIDPDKDPSIKSLSTFHTSFSSPISDFSLVRVTQAGDPDPIYPFTDEGDLEFLNDICEDGTIVQQITLLGTDLLNDEATRVIPETIASMPRGGGGVTGLVVSGTGIFIPESNSYFGLLSFYHPSQPSIIYTGPGVLKLGETNYFLCNTRDGNISGGRTTETFLNEHIYVSKTKIGEVEYITLHELYHGTYTASNEEKTKTTGLTRLVPYAEDLSFLGSTLIDDTTGESIEKTIPDPRYATGPYDPRSEEQKKEDHIEEETSTTDPNTIGGDGDWDASRESTPLLTTDLPSPSNTPSALSIADTSFRIYKCTSQGLENFMSALVSNNVVDKLKEFFTADPMSFVQSLHIVPGRIPHTQTTSLQNITLAGQTLEVGGNPVQLNRIVNNTTTGDIGNIIKVSFKPVDITKSIGGFIDYDSTFFQIYLPFIGYRDIDAKDIWDKPDNTYRPTGNVQLNLYYLIDFAFGFCNAILYKSFADSPLDSIDVIGNWSGTCRMDIPVSQARYNNYLTSIGSFIGSGILTAASIGTGNVAGGIAGGLGMVGSLGGLWSADTKPSVTSREGHSGTGWMSPKVPFIKVYRPVPTLKDGYGHFNGWCWREKTSVSHFGKGKFIKFSDIHFSETKPPEITKDELMEIESKLKGGVYR